MKILLQVPHAKPAQDTITVYSPFNQQELATVETVNRAGVEQALVNAFTVFKDRSQWLSADKRVAILEKTAQLMEARFEQFVQVASHEGGKPLSDTQVEVRRAIDGVKNCVECIRSEHGTEIPMRLNPASANRVAFTRKEPIGVVVSFSAFNHPLNLIVHQVAPAVATGCPVIIKPANDTPMSAFLFAALLHEAGLGKVWCQPLLTCDYEVAGQLASDARVDFFSFIGSSKIGWRLRAKLAAGTRCALEHGGAAPVIVAEDADLDDVLPLLAKGGFYHAGQVCVSVQRVFAHQSIAAKVAQRLADIASQYVMGDPLDATTEIGPLIRHAETVRIDAWVKQAQQEGAEIICGGNVISAAFYAATVLLNPSPKSLVSCREIFGPVICVYTYNDLDDAIAQANNVPYAFQAAVCTKNIDTALYASSHLNASAVMVNDHTAFRVDWMPFAGLKESGYGMGGIPYTYKDMQIEKLTVIRSAGLK